MRSRRAASCAVNTGGMCCTTNIGTGSGAIAVTLAAERPDLTLVATDTSAAALVVAEGNAARHGVAGRIAFRRGSLLEPLAGDAPFDLIVANLPYVREDEWPGLAPEIRNWEPREALVAGTDGLDAIRTVLPHLEAGVVALELGEGQAGAVAALVEAAGFSDVEVRRDLAGIERVVAGRRSTG